MLATDYYGYTHNNDLYEIVSLDNVLEYSLSEHSTKETPIPFTKPSPIVIKSCHKRSHSLEDVDFPPIQSVQGSSRKKLRSPTLSLIRSRSQSRSTESSSKNRNYFSYPINCQYSDSPFPPCMMTESFLSESGNTMESSLTLDELVRQVDHSIYELSSSESGCGYRQVYVSYNFLNYSWRVLYYHATRYCEVKIQVFTAPSSHSKAVSGDFLVTHEHVKGETELSKLLFAEIKHSIQDYQDEMDRYFLSQCVVSEARVNENENLDRCRKVFLDRLLSSSSLFHTLSTSGASDFYLEPANSAYLKNLIVQLYEYDSVAQQCEAIKEICEICHHSPRNDTKVFTLLEDLGLIEALLSLFTPGTSPLWESKEDFCRIAQYVVGILQYFVSSSTATRKLLQDNNFTEFLTMVLDCRASLSALSGTSLNFPWLKLFNDCEQLSEELARVVVANSEMDTLTYSKSIASRPLFLSLMCKC